MDFYPRLLIELARTGELDPAASTLVVAGDEHDRDALMAAGFEDVTISNLDERAESAALAPYRWARLDAEAIDAGDGSYAQVIAHMGLHHCASPHRAVLEMYRVASNTVLAIENRDSLLMRLAARAGMARDYEFEAVRDAGYRGGGVRNSGVPNHVYRWTEREVAKTLASADPAHAVAVRYRYALRFPNQRIGEARGLRRALFSAARWPVALIARAFPSQANVFAFLIDKRGRRLHPWMESGERMKRASGEP
jgi:hypothetical protein